MPFRALGVFHPLYNATGIQLQIGASGRAKSTLVEIEVIEMSTTYIEGTEYYMPDDEDIKPHGIDCSCNECMNAKMNRHGAYYNGFQWMAIL